MKAGDFFSTFNSENACIQHFRDTRESTGIICKNCGCRRHYWVEKLKSWRCMNCRYYTGIKSGTIMAHSKLSIMTWYHGLYHIATNKKSMSAKELQRTLGLKRYEPVWYMRKKIQFAFRQSNNRYLKSQQLSIQQMMQSLFNIRSLGRNYRDGGPIVKQNKVVIIPESTDSIIHRGHPQLMILISLGSKLTKVERRIIENSQYRTRFCYKRLTRFGEYHFKDKEVPGVSRHSWAEKAINNSRRILSGINHLVQNKYLQFALDEFTFKFNNRGKPDIFSSALTSLVCGSW